ncbi:baseplate J/gp47 family protein [Blautia sp. MSJ-9]|uniref:baseplate J/gp47 family protein n=1 Tax=Blautia sp. MSJ-9 TaxID=2841511 RepID=UPI001C104F5F|nr:baseplate J/gp47 family protein [Blautia sp. MSJ-9]MBU5680078.1 baseplate J/gp47 family protein [Blautia sp. MSJ-9]
MAETMEKKIQKFKEAMALMLADSPMEVDTEIVGKLKNIEDLPLNDITEDVLIEQFYDMGAFLNVDARQGSIYWDACMGSIIRTSMLLEQLKMVKEIISLDTCTGDVLDEKMAERGLVRNPEKPTPATYYVNFIGQAPDLDSKMSVEEYFFILSQDSEGRYILISEDMGTDMNNLASGLKVVPELDVDGLIAATLGELAIPATDAEDDDSARERLKNRISGPDENGNKSQVRTWCESVEGVGAARIIPLWNGPYTVKGILVSTTGGVPSQTVVDNVQNYIDPGCTGMGEGVANIGQFFTAEAVEAIKVDITVSVLKKNDATYSGIQEGFKELLQKYFTDMALEEYANGMAIRYVRVGAILENMDEVIDYDQLKLNGKSVNITFTNAQVPVLGEVTVDGNIL